MHLWLMPRLQGAQGKDISCDKTPVSPLQGVIVAAPVYAATGSRLKAMGIAVASVHSLLHPLHALVCAASALGYIDSDEL
jgi:hypothetical protein